MRRQPSDRGRSPHRATRNSGSETCRLSADCCAPRHSCPQRKHIPGRGVSPRRAKRAKRAKSCVRRQKNWLSSLRPSVSQGAAYSSSLAIGINRATTVNARAKESATINALSSHRIRRRAPAKTTHAAPDTVRTLKTAGPTDITMRVVQWSRTPGSMSARIRRKFGMT